MQLSREFFDTLIFIVAIVGLILAARRLRADYVHAHQRGSEPDWAKDDTQPGRTTED